MPSARSETSGDQERAGPALRRRELIALAIGLPVSALLLAKAVQGIDLGSVWSTLEGADLVRVALAVVAMAMVYVLQAARWRFIARRYGLLPMRSALSYVIGGVAVNNVVPGRPGELARAYWISNALHIPKARGLSTVIVDRGADVLTLIAFVAVTYAFVPHPTWVRDLAIAAVVLGSLLLAGLLACRWYVSRRERSGKGIPDRLRALWLVRQVAQVVRGTAATVTARDAVVIGAVSVAAWAVWGLAAYLTAGALSIHLSLTEVLFVTAMVNLGVSIPSSPGFIGTYQWLCVSALGLFGINKGDAFAFSVLMHAVWFVPTTLVGAALVVLHGSSLRRIRTESITPAMGEPAR